MSDHIRLLQDLKETYKRTEVLLPSLRRHVLKKSQEEDERQARWDILHPSDMAKIDWCGRHDYYRLTQTPAADTEKPPSFRMSNIYDYGHSIHDKYQTWFREMGTLWGSWECLACGSRFPGLSPEACIDCASPDLRYREVPLEIPGLHIGGHADGVVCLPDILPLLIEIKSIGFNSLRYESFRLWTQAQEEQLTPEEVWFLIKRPFPAHIRQGMLYLHLVRMLYPGINPDRIVFIYEWKPTQEVKEFVVNYNGAPIAKVLETVAAIDVALRDGEPLDRPGWAIDADCKGCKHCEYRDPCWGTSPPSAPTGPTIRIQRAPSARRKALRAGAGL